MFTRHCYLYFLLALVLFGLTGCAGMKMTGKGKISEAIFHYDFPQESYGIIESYRRSNETRPDGLFSSGTRWMQPPTHAKTTSSVFQAAEYLPEREFVLSYYSKYPDLDRDYNAIPVSVKYLANPWKRKWLHDVNGALHSLHGGGRAAIDARRRNIEQALSESLKDERLDWLSGLLIHAYGDSYVHTKHKADSAEEKAYGPLIGHALPSLFGDDPDNMKVPETKKKYLLFIDKLYSIITREKDNFSDIFPDTTGGEEKPSKEFETFRDAIADYDCNTESCDTFWLDTDPIHQAKLDAFETYMTALVRPLSEEEIQLAVDLIKGERRLNE